MLQEKEKNDTLIRHSTKVVARNFERKYEICLEIKILQFKTQFYLHFLCIKVLSLGYKCLNFLNHYLQAI